MISSHGTTGNHASPPATVAIDTHASATASAPAPDEARSISLSLLPIARQAALTDTSGAETASTLLGVASADIEAELSRAAPSIPDDGMPSTAVVCDQLFMHGCDESSTILCGVAFLGPALLGTRTSYE